MAYTITEAQAAELLKIADTLVGKQVKSGLISNSDRDDYIQELMLIMVQHQDDWTVPEGVRFEAYANTVMEKRLISIWRKRNHKRDVMTDVFSLNATYLNDDGDEEEFINRLTESGMMDGGINKDDNWTKARLIAEIRLFVATLPNEERELCELLMHHSVPDATKILNKSRLTIWRIIERIRKKAILAEIHSGRKKNQKK